MNLHLENPFADYGAIVRGKRFIGRRSDLHVIDNRVIRPSEGGNLAIIGEPRIGKSSLAYQAIMERKDELLDSKILPIWINLALSKQASELFCLLVQRCLGEMEDLNWLTKSTRQIAKRSLQDNLSWNEKYSQIQRFFEKVRQAGVRVVFILDEFDAARRIFHDDVSGFQGLRELSYQPDCRVTFLTTSRRSIRDIELQTRALSTLDGIFHKHYLALFSQEDMEEYYQRLLATGIPVSPSMKEKINFYCGEHPYLLELLGYELVESFGAEQFMDVDQTANQIIQSFTTQYERIEELLREDESLSKLLQILFGPVINVKRTDVDEFLRYGLIKRNDNGSYMAFSGHFETYLSLLARGSTLDLWPIWSEAELALRRLITTKMLEKHGEMWIEKLEKSRSHLKSIFEQCRAIQKKEERAFSSRASRNLIDFTYPQDLFAIIFAEWGTFKTTLGRDKNYWAQRSELLSKVRNPMAHNRNQALYDYERRIADGYCREIITIINEPY